MSTHSDFRANGCEHFLIRFDDRRKIIVIILVKTLPFRASQINKANGTTHFINPTCLSRINICSHFTSKPMVAH